VLSLKLLALMQHQRIEGESRLRHPRLALHGVAFGAGVVASFVSLAAALAALQAGGAQLGWGFQLQTPWVVAALTALFFLIGLNLLGAFEFAFGAGVAGSTAAQRLQRDTPWGSFWTGVLAVVVAAPCTAPFMGAALGYAVTQPAAIGITVFAVLGVGMALPYLALTLVPGLLDKLPRPGAWMERFKQVMAFPMFLTCVWLVWVLAQQLDVNAVGLLLAALVLLGLAAWAFGLVQRGATRWRWVALGAAGLAAYSGISATAAPAAPALREASDAGSAQAGVWQPWSRAAVEQATRAGRPVFIDYTAAWCVTCQANKRLVLQGAAVEQAFAASGVVRMRADWTRRDAEIAQELARFNRNGVPLYVLVDRGGNARVLPELLTERIVVDALAQL
jgi:thiol:disulfide interchange protein DsbD